VLHGNASITQKGRGEAHGDKLTYNTETSEMTGESGGDGMVHMTFKPKPVEAAAPAGASAPAPATTAPASPAATQEQP
jgi:lipopolysaccharide export system protein LptA